MAKIFSRTLELATDQTNVDPNWSEIMECIDLIRGNEVSTKDAASMIVKRLRNSNPHVVHHTLLLLEACMKNCGSQFHREVLSTRFLEELKEIITHNPPSSEVSKKLLEMIQVWYSAFGSKQQFTAVKDIHTILQVSGYQFPAAKESDHMFAAQCAPDWVDGDQCFRCRADFTLFKRRHHCRACGQIFCDACSSRQMYLPQFGIEKNVRVCETCFEKTPTMAQAPPVQSKKADEEARREKELEDKFQEDLQLALALSQSVSNQNPYALREETKRPVEPEQTSYYPSNEGLDDSVYRGAAAPSISNDSGDDRLSDVGVDSVLARYLDRDYWQKKLESNLSSAHENILPEPDTPEPFLRSTTPTVESVTSRMSSVSTNNYEDSDDISETKNFCNNISELVDTLENRMRSNALRGRSIVNDNAVHSLFVQLTEKHANIMQRMNALEESRTQLEQLQDHVVHIQDARSAINTLRQEHERMRQEQLLAAQRLRQQQMQHTLQYMRWQKTMSLESRRAEALKRFHEQERSIYMDRYTANGSPFAPPNQPQTVMNPQEMYQQPQFFQHPQQPQIPPNSGYPVNFNGTNPSFEPPTSIPSESLNQQQQFYPPQQSQIPSNGGYPANFNGSVHYENSTAIPTSDQVGQQHQFFQPQQPQMYQQPVQQFSGPQNPEFQQIPPQQMLPNQGVQQNFQQQYYSWK